MLRRTPLFEEHQALGAKIVPFAGYEMPVQYPDGITAEHEAVRKAAGLFDVSHMGEFLVRGPQALEFVQHLAVNDASKLEVGQAQYSAMCRPDGGIIDDLLVYRFPDHYMLVVNGARRTEDWAWASRQAEGFDVSLEDRSDAIALLALQGPAAPAILRQLTETDLDSIEYYHFAQGSVDGIDAIISRTGYTGEDGFELYVAADAAAPLWRRLLEVGAPLGLKPAGLGARDSLRLELGYALYGNDLDESRNPIEAGLSWIVKLDRGEFVGRDVLVRTKEKGPAQRLVGLRLTERAFPRAGYPVVAGGEEVGALTSGTLSPTLGCGVALAYVPAALAKAGTALSVRIRGKDFGAQVERPPFYRDGSIRR
ncbi:MAG: glycine cleavage system aminomethyltransferase GcvT [Gemmatimonadota bacterium]